jgi:hypothetical protein
MDKAETIQVITRHLPAADAETLEAIRDVLVTAPSAKQHRTLTAAERALAEQSKADFAAGQTMTLQDLEAFLDASAAERAAHRRP